MGYLVQWRALRMIYCGTDSQDLDWDPYDKNVKSEIQDEIGMFSAAVVAPN